MKYRARGNISNFFAQGSAIVLVLVFTTICLIILLGLLGWVTSNARLTQRHCQYSRSVAAAEAATEKVLTAISTDYKNLGQGYVLANLDTYRHMCPTSSEDPAWGDNDRAVAEPRIGQRGTRGLSPSSSMDHTGVHTLHEV